MSVIFLNFYSSLEASEKNDYRNKNIYSTPLMEQFDIINKRLPLNMRFEDIRSFIENAFPSGLSKKYYISCPNYKREIVKGTTANFLRNVVIRADGTELSRRLPNNMSVILIGDIIEGERLKMLSVKGIELIDEGFTKYGETVIMNSFACSAFQRNSWSIRHVDYNETYFTPDNILNLIQTNYPVRDAYAVTKFYQTWDNYLKFREYYLQTQTQRHFPISNIEYKESFSINRRRYQKNTDLYETNLLDGHKEFLKGELIVLENELDDTDPFPLIRVDIEYNRLEFLEETIEKNGRKINKIETSIRSFARDNLALSEFPPRNEKYNEQLKNSFQLEQRFKIIKSDIEPDCTDLEQKYTKAIREQLLAIDAIYQQRIEKETIEASKIKEQELLLSLNVELNSYKNSLNDNLDNDIKEIDDNNIKQKYHQSLEKIKKQLKRDYENRLNGFNQGLKKEKNKDRLKEIKKHTEELKKVYDNDVKNAHLEIDVRQMFLDRNEKLFESRSNELQIEFKKNLKEYSDMTKKQLVVNYQDMIRKDKNEKKQELEEELRSAIEKRIHEETIVRFSLYFKTDTENQLRVYNAISNKKYRYLIYNNRAEQAKIDRQRNALESFFEGNVKNPYLSTFLFSPEDLNPNTHHNREWNWFLEKLNDKQKEAVKKAVTSNGVFLLQGPPGTGKTQVISEIVGHLIKDGKKVLISSETHKAIDNVFERLPKIAEIRPIRLMTSQSGKDSDYSPENLVDNLYLNIAEQMKKTIKSYENFSEYKDKFDLEFKELKMLNKMLNKNKTKSDEISKSIVEHERLFDELKEERNTFTDKKEIYVYDKDKYVNTYKRIQNHQFIFDEDLDMTAIEDYKQTIKGSIDDSIFDVSNIDLFISLIFRTKPQEIIGELKNIRTNKDSYELQEQRQLLIREIQEMLDISDGEITDSIKDKQKQLREVKIKLDTFDDNLDISGMAIGKIFNTNWLSNHQDDAIEVFDKLQTTLLKIKNEHTNNLSSQAQKQEDKISKVNTQIAEIDSKLKDISNKISDLRENQSYHNYQDSKNKIEIKIENFLKQFDIVANYKTIDEALKFIQTEWEDLELNFKEKEMDNRIKIPVYRKISDYIQKEEIIMEDRKRYTKPLFDTVNLFGTTTTSRDRFDEKSMSELELYNLGELDLRKQGIDVVIIDEVSKSSFIELLIPILYGKTVILVGDHRQLPPMYEYRNFRDEDYEGLDSDIINPTINKRYTEMYENSFFKMLFEKAPNDYKIMLTKQYRSHEHIMNVFNHFYNKNLELGDVSQNSHKKHYLNVEGNQRLIIEQDKHIYFVDSKEYESRSEDSTSIHNKGEADIVIELLKKIDDAYQQNKDFNPRVNKNLRIDERMSIGVICTYGDQAQLIKQKRKSNKLTNFKSFNEKSDSKLIVSTVDDFQGDERDIIIVSMVRNPKEPGKSNPGFITAYQRINVAFSRARRLLIIVGNKDYLTKKGVIDLPDVMGDINHDQKNFRVYEKVIDTIRTYGKLIDDVDIIKEGGNTK
ncbi:MAG: AAA domain-containing protein [Bacilli bacterium]|nr:AAA domain-containing protein [Bacilli bacterium]